MPLPAPEVAVLVVLEPRPPQLPELQALPRGPHSMPKAQPELPPEPQPEWQSLSVRPQEERLPARNLRYSEQV